jgi:hypothetical protein
MKSAYIEPSSAEAPPAIVQFANAAKLVFAMHVWLVSFGGCLRSYAFSGWASSHAALLLYIERRRATGSRRMMAKRAKLKSLGGIRWGRLLTCVRAIEGVASMNRSAVVRGVQRITMHLVASRRILPHYIPSHSITSHLAASHRTTSHLTASHRISPHHTGAHTQHEPRITRPHALDGVLWTAPWCSIQGGRLPRHASGRARSVQSEGLKSLLKLDSSPVSVSSLVRSSEENGTAKAATLSFPSSDATADIPASCAPSSHIAGQHSPVLPGPRSQKSWKFCAHCLTTGTGGEIEGGGGSRFGGAGAGSTSGPVIDGTITSGSGDGSGDGDGCARVSASMMPLSSVWGASGSVSRMSSNA